MTQREFGNYAAFAGDVSALQMELTERIDYTTHPQFLGDGNVAAVFALSRDDGDHVVRTGKSAPLREREVGKYVDGLTLGRGFPGFEQIEAASYDRGVVVSERVPGRTIHQIGIAAVSGIPDQHFGQLFELIGTATDKQIYLDMTPKNLLHDTDAGFGVIDYAKARPYETDRFHHTVRETALSFISDETGPLRTPAIAEQAHDLTSKKLDFLDRFDELGYRYLGSASMAEVLLGDIRANLQDKLCNYSDPTFIATCIANWAQIDAQQQ